MNLLITALTAIGVASMVITAVLLLLMLLLKFRRSRRLLHRIKKEERFFDGGGEASAYLSIVHVEPETVPLALDANRGPADLKGIIDASSALSDLSTRKGLWLYEGSAEDSPSACPQSGQPRCSSGLFVSDAASIAYLSDSGKDVELPMLVAPLSSMPAARRALFLLSPRDPGEGAPPSLGQLVRSKQPVHVFCPTGIESALFSVAWAVAGGGDVAEAPQVTVMTASGGGMAWASAARDALAAYAYEASQSFVIVPVWACPGSLAHKTILSAWTPARRNVASVSYHPLDDESPDAFLVETAPHMIKARAPALAAAPVQIIPDSRPSNNSPSRTQTVLVAPSLIFLHQSPDSRSIDSMADAISDALLKGQGTDPETTMALCTFYEANGIPLLPRTEQTVRAFEMKRANAEAGVGSPYSRPELPIMEQFRDARDARDDPPAPPVELVPERPIRLSITPVGDRDSFLIGGGYVEATLAPPGTDSIDGVRLRLGDRVILERQEDNAANGTWIVVATSGEAGTPILQQPVALNPRGGYSTKLERTPKPSAIIEAGWQWRFSVPIVNEEGGGGVLPFLREGDRVAWMPLPGAPTGTVTAVGKSTAGLPWPRQPTPTSWASAVGAELPWPRQPTSWASAVVELVVPASMASASPEATAFEAEWFDPLGRCLDVDAIGHTSDTRQQCDALYSGSRGRTYVWDKPCTHDAECPYLQSGTEERRGRCLESGRCEAPIGVKPAAYRNIASDGGIVCSCQGDSDSKKLSLRAASEECCSTPGSTPLFPLGSV